MNTREFTVPVFVRQPGNTEGNAGRLDPFKTIGYGNQPPQKAAK
jgi:hypothetical protein